MKKVAFAWVTEWVDFDSKYEAIKFALSERKKGHRIATPAGGYAYTEEEIIDAVYINGNELYCYTVRIEKPYRNYEMG